MTILALETSCDETAVAILRGSELLASEVASQTAEHEKFGGVVPEVASRNHLVHAPRLLERVARQAKVEISQIDAFAATSGPGLASSLMIGASIAKGLAIGFGKPYLAINHLEGHLLSPFFGGADRDDEIRANVSLIVSGGHTLLVRVHALCDYQVVGRGSRRAESPDEKSFAPARDDKLVSDLCASLQQAIIDVLVTKTITAAQKYDVDFVTVSGGVSCNQELRRQLQEACIRNGFQ